MTMVWNSAHRMFQEVEQKGIELTCEFTLIDWATESKLIDIASFATSAHEEYLKLHHCTCLPLSDRRESLIECHLLDPNHTLRQSVAFAARRVLILCLQRSVRINITSLLRI